MQPWFNNFLQQVLPMLRCLVMSECPVSDEDDYRVEVLVVLRRRIERLDKDEYTEEERIEAEEIAEQRAMDGQRGTGGFGGLLGEGEGEEGDEEEDPLLIDDEAERGKRGAALGDGTELSETANDFDFEDELE